MSSKLFIGGLNYDTTEKKLYEALSEFGKVLTLRIIIDRESGRSKGFGFATFEEESCAQKAIDSLDNTEFDGRRIGVKPAIEK
jgi:RNA recognition motif-containing protein